jgi:hypothetical protein
MQLQLIQQKIHEIRNQKVMLDFDLAELYETETKYLKRAVRQNITRFPADFMFELTREEYNSLRCNFSTLESEGRGKYSKYLPFAFTEQGVAMLSSVLNSGKAINVNIAIMRAFVFLRQFALRHKELSEKIKKLERKYNKQFKDVYEALNLLLQENQDQKNWEDREMIGFKK